MAAKVLFIAVSLMLVSVAVSAPGPRLASSKRAQIEDIAAKAAVAYVQKLFHFEIDDDGNNIEQLRADKIYISHHSWALTVIDLICMLQQLSCN